MTPDPRTRLARLATWLSSPPNLVIAVGCLILLVGLVASIVGRQVEPTIFGTAGVIVGAGLTAAAARDANQKPPSGPG